MHDVIRDLYRHMEWADAHVWRAAEETAGAAADPVLRARLHHIHLVQRAFLSVWNGKPFDRREVAEFADLDALREWGRGYFPEVEVFLAALEDRDLDAVLELPWAVHLTELLGHAPAVTTLRDTLLQVAAHSTYHRGQVNLRLRELGTTPPLVDYIAWIWQGRPAAEWPATTASA
jgi:uncharacterized damage-inducible protein DinB